MQKFGDYVLLAESDLDEVREIKNEMEVSLDRAIKSNGYERKTPYTFAMQGHPEDQKYTMSITCFAKELHHEVTHI